jgi:hypothetical protein
MKLQHLCLGLVLLSLSCQSTNRSSSGLGHVDHVVLIWLKDPTDHAVRHKIIEASEAFRQIPGVLDVRQGRPVPSTRPIVDSSFDIGFVITFESRAALDAYGPHPIHQKAAQELIQPNTKQIKVYDIVDYWPPRKK